MKRILLLVSLLFGINTLTGNFTVQFNATDSGHPESIVLKIYGAEELTYSVNLHTPLTLPTELGKEFQISALKFPNDAAQYNTGRLEIKPGYTYTIYKVEPSQMSCNAGDTRYQGLCVHEQSTATAKSEKEHKEGDSLS